MRSSGDHAAAPDITTQEHSRRRRYILNGEGTAPVRWWWATPPLPPNVLPTLIECPAGGSESILGKFGSGTGDEFAAWERDRTAMGSTVCGRRAIKSIAVGIHKKSRREKRRPDAPRGSVDPMVSPKAAPNADSSVQVGGADSLQEGWRASVDLDDTHVTKEYVEKLRQAVDSGVAEKAADSGDLRLRPARSRFV